MPDLRTELKQGSAYKNVYGVIAHAMKVHNEREGCTFKRSTDEIADEVFEFLVAKVEDAEDNCPLHQNGATSVGFNDCPKATASGFTDSVDKRF